MKVAAIIISNRPEKLEKCLTSFDDAFHGTYIKKYVELNVLIQPPFSEEGHEFLLIANNEKLIDAVESPTPYAWLRKQAMLMSTDANWFWSFDDDHVFNKKCVPYYESILNYLEEDLEYGKVGVLNTKGHRDNIGSEFIINPPNGIISTGKGGFFFRNVGIEKIISKMEEKLVGALFESLAAYNIMSMGYNKVSRYNCPTECDENKVIGVSDNLAYNKQVVENNILGRIRAKFDLNWEYSNKKYPRTIAKKLGIQQ